MFLRRICVTEMFNWFEFQNFGSDLQNWHFNTCISFIQLQNCGHTILGTV